MWRHEERGSHCGPGTPRTETPPRYLSATCSSRRGWPRGRQDRRGTWAALRHSRFPPQGTEVFWVGDVHAGRAIAHLRRDLSHHERIARLPYRKLLWPVRGRWCARLLATPSQAREHTTDQQERLTCRITCLRPMRSRTWGAPATATLPRARTPRAARPQHHHAARRLPHPI